MSNYLIWLLQVVGILALVFIAIILLVIVGGCVFAVVHGIFKGGR